MQPFPRNQIQLSDVPSFQSVITARNEGCGKVMFLHLSVSHSVTRGACVPPTPLPHTPPAMHAPVPHTPAAMHPPPHMPPLPCMPPLPRATRCGQWAGGAHATGMHSCFRSPFSLAGMLQTKTNWAIYGCLDLPYFFHMKLTRSTFMFFLFCNGLICLISRIRWIQVGSVKYDWRLLKSFLCVPLTVGTST